MTDLHIGSASGAELGEVLAFWKTAAEGTSISDDLAGVERLHDRDPGYRRQGIGAALPAAAEERFAALGGRRGDAMVLDRNERAHRVWDAVGYRPQEQWTRWVKPLG
ncbi:GNAT family N-acetyltransferase [Streptomyces nojiriensis]|uniref:GNAT family N-acetyltransferase n=1 Tax=Streptomyces nojiriensis TaxID=66374 RepID=UPI0036498FFC